MFKTTNPDEKTSWFQKQVQRFQMPLTRYAISIIHSVESAREVVQDVFLKMWRQESFESDSGLRVWLFKTCRNSCIDLLRKEGRMGQLTDEGQDSLECPNELPSEVLEKKEMHETILDRFSDLPAKHQDVLRLKFQEDLSYKEISEITGHSVNHVGVLIHQGVIKLRESMSKEGGRHGA